MKHAAPEPPRRWFGLRRAKRSDDARETRTDVVDLRTPSDDVALADDPESVLARMARLRDAGLITSAELEHERRRILGAEAERG